ncbi:rolling circle replication-associated protein [Methanococcus maripaludis]|uniref:DNA-binding PadR family transcriptional regulator n=1 Tax=Methanococcus maripaludis TaxID=39152 RepID=A0A7J9PP10_METMI|nr:hypothetical protein [Methanococcus maripaludis]MBA2864450.1 DNA-binding PadR family transcriptional regulator [Methanococcus maripaludis]
MITDRDHPSIYYDHDQIAAYILRLCKFEKYYIASLHRAVEKRYYTNVSYKTIERIVKKLESEGKISRAAEQSYYTTAAGQALLLELTGSETSTIQNSQNSDDGNGSKTLTQNWDGVNDKKNWIIRKMERIVNENSVLDITDEVAKKKRYDLNFLYVEYVYDNSQKRLILKLKDHFQGMAAPYKVMPFSTRFTDTKLLQDKEREFDRRFAHLSKKHNKAVFLTLTTDPKRFDSLIEASDAMFKNFKKLMDRFNRRYRRKTGEKLEYIYGFEFSPVKAIPHMHIVIFGSDYLDLADHRKSEKNLTEKEKKKSVYAIRDIWSSYGQGEIVDIKSISKVNTLDKGAIWKFKRNSRPRDARKDDDSVLNYLKKYLRKTMRTIKRVTNILKSADKDHPVAEIKKECYKQLGVVPLYMATGKRFFGSSLIPKEENPDIPDLEKISMYDVMLACYENAVPENIKEAIWSYNNGKQKSRRGGFGSLSLSNYSIERGGW